MSNICRKNLIRDIKKCLENTTKKIDFNFIYGTVSGDVFYPVDGQQRLTSLYLLHVRLRMPVKIVGLEDVLLKDNCMYSWDDKTNIYTIYEFLDEYCYEEIKYCLNSEMEKLKTANKDKQKILDGYNEEDFENIYAHGNAGSIAYTRINKSSWWETSCEEIKNESLPTIEQKCL